MLKISSAALSTAFIVILSTSCSTGGQSSGSEKAKASNDSANVVDARPTNRETGGGLWDQLRSARQAKEQRIANQAQLADRAQNERARVPSDIRTKLERWWTNFVNDDPSWLDDRQKWKKEGAQAMNLLVENLIILMMGAYDIGNGILHRRARAELVELQDYSKSYLVAGIAQSKADDVVTTNCVETVGLIGAAATPSIIDAYDDAEFKGRFNLLRTMSRIADPNATPFLAKIVEGNGDYTLRFTAVEALGKSRDPRAVPVLVRALDEDDISVRKFAAGYLGSFKDRSAVTPLIAAMKKAESKRFGDPVEGEVAANCSRSLSFITDQRFRTAAQWEAWNRSN